MDIEQRSPKKPNFALVFTLAGVALLVLMVVAYFTLDWDGKRLVPHHRNPHPNSRLELPRGDGAISYRA
jgi:hypothetical protein